MQRNAANTEMKFSSVLTAQSWLPLNSRPHNALRAEYRNVIGIRHHFQEDKFCTHDASHRLWSFFDIALLTLYRLDYYYDY